jgi:hypothetical protein
VRPRQVTYYLAVKLTGLSLPLWTDGKQRTLRWNRFDRPNKTPEFGAADFPAIWWWDADKAERQNSLGRRMWCLKSSGCPDIARRDMRVLITGTSGQIGGALMASFAGKATLVAVIRAEPDLSPQ